MTKKQETSEISENEKIAFHFLRFDGAAILLAFVAALAALGSSSKFMPWVSFIATFLSVQIISDRVSVWRFKAHSAKTLRHAHFLTYQLGARLLFPYLVGGPCLCGVLLLLVTVGQFVSNVWNRPCIEYKSVKSVGGCDALGNCGVEYSDGTFGSLNKPNRNQLNCTRKKDIF